MDLFPVRAAEIGACRSLQPRVSRDEAVRAFGGGNATPLQLIGRLTRGRIHAVADVYVPYHLFRVEVVDRGCRQTSYFAIDAVAGALDLYGFEHDAAELDLVTIQSRNRLSRTLDAAAAWPLLAAKLERALFQNGFFRLRHPQLTGHREPVDLHIPYWLGFYQRNAGIKFDVLDAVRHRIEGGKARALFEEWLRS
jgi:hypothetical protein